MPIQHTNDIGVTEQGDPALSNRWIPWVNAGRPTVLITKNPAAVLRQLRQLPSTTSRLPNVILHCGITGWGATPIEPNVPTPTDSFAAYHEAIQWLGLEHVILRLDPIFLTEEGIQKAKAVAQQRAPNGRMRISFLDCYPHVKDRFRAAKIPAPQTTFHAGDPVRRKLWEELGKPEICAEPGLPCTPCIGTNEANILGVHPQPNLMRQRPLCGCLMNKRELLDQRKPCAHGCLYCYWKDPQVPTAPRFFR